MIFKKSVIFFFNFIGAIFQPNKKLLRIISIQNTFPYNFPNFCFRSQIFTIGAWLAIDTRLRIRLSPTESAATYFP